jgi:hypothetical protein
LRENDVHFFTTQNEETKASIVERFNGTLKTKMWKYLTHRETLTYLHVLQDLVESEQFFRPVERSLGFTESHSIPWLESTFLCGSTSAVQSFGYRRLVGPRDFCRGNPIVL